MLDAEDDDVRKRAGLLSLYTEAEELLNKLDPQIVAPLQQSVPDFAQKLKNHKLQLTQKEYFVLVAGKSKYTYKIKEHYYSFKTYRLF